MKQMVDSLLILVSLLLLWQPAGALTITSPKENEIVYAGSQLTVIAKPDAEEDWLSVSFGFDQMTYNPLTKEYKITIPVPRDYYGYYDNLIVLATDKNKKTVEIKRTIFVKLPPNVVLNSLLLSNEIMALRKVPQGGNLVDAAKIETRQLGVAGVYSDGISRQIASSSMGTTYTSSDEKVVTVSPEGKVTAQGLGNATITVRNGKFSATVKVVVKPYIKGN